jgi:nitrate/TMAO reductase-like tetraheme cytochrome c subunit
MTAEGLPEASRAPRRSRRRRLVLLALAAVVVVGIVGTAGLWQVSSSPQFCNSCHIMGPYVQGWKASKHAAVACVQCHYPPGFRDTLRVKFEAMTQVAKWATGTYNSKPFAEVEDGSCLRSGCHSSAQLAAQGMVVSGPGIRFDHRPHLDPAKTGRQLRCTSCHSQIIVERHFEVDRRACFVCHFKGTKHGRELTPIAGCTGCHEPPKRDFLIGAVRFNHEDVVRRGVACQKCHLSVVEGEGESPRERCLTCHNQPEKLQRYADTRLLHDAHVTRHPIECIRCHSEIKHKLPPPIGIPTASDPPGDAVVAAAPHS